MTRATQGVRRGPSIIRPLSLEGQKGRKGYQFTVYDRSRYFYKCIFKPFKVVGVLQSISENSLLHINHSRCEWQLQVIWGSLSALHSWKLIVSLQ